MQSLIRSKSAGVTGGRGTAGAGPGRVRLSARLAWWSVTIVTDTTAAGHQVAGLRTKTWPGKQMRVLRAVA